MRGKDLIGQDNSISNFMDIDESGVVWTSSVESGREIFYYNGHETINISAKNPQNDHHNRRPKIRGKNIVWISGLGSNKIYLYDGDEVKNISNINPKRNPLQLKIDGDIIAWLDQPSNTNTDHVFYYNGTETQIVSLQYTEYILNSGDLQISENNIVWRAYDGNDFHIYLYDGNNIQKLSDLESISPTQNKNARIHGDDIVWQGLDENNKWQIYHYDGHEVNILTASLTDITKYNINPQVHNGSIVWEGGVNYISNLFIYNGQEIVNLGSKIPEAANVHFPKIEGNNIVWVVGRNGLFTIYLYDGTQVTEVAETIIWETYQISNGIISWVEWYLDEKGQTQTDVLIYKCKDNQVIPTLSEWGVIHLGLFLLIFGVLYSRSPILINYN